MNEWMNEWKKVGNLLAFDSVKKTMVEKRVSDILWAFEYVSCRSNLCLPVENGNSAMR